MPDLVIVNVGATGDTELGRYTLRDDAILPDGEFAADLLARLRRDSGLSDRRLWDHLMRTGWSNGYATVQRPRNGAA